MNKSKYNIAALYILLIICIITIVNTGITANFREVLNYKSPYLDKVGHFFGMGILAFVLNNLFYNYKSNRITLASLGGIIIAFAFSTLEEFSQKQLIYRSFSYGDLIANYLGILSFTVFFFWIIRSEKFKTQNV